MAFDEYGFPLANEIFEGNMADTKTLVVAVVPALLVIRRLRKIRFQQSYQHNEKI